MDIVDIMSDDARRRRNSSNDNGDDFNNNNLPSQLRFIGGSEQMIHGILRDFQMKEKDEEKANEKSSCVTIHCQHKAIAIDKQEDNSSVVVIAMNLKTQQKVSFVAEKTVTIAIPPRLILRDIKFTRNNHHVSSFQLPHHKKAIMEQTPIWMERASKVFLTYKIPIWKDQRYQHSKNRHSYSLPLRLKDGVFVFDVTNDNHNGIHALSKNNKQQKYMTMKEDEETTINNTDANGDDSNGDMKDTKYYTICLFQFCSPTPITNESLSQTYLRDLSQIFDSRMISHLHQIQIHNWVSQPFTSSQNGSDTTTNTSAVGNIPPSYLFGNSELRKPFDDNIFFSSTETEQEHGHMEGALKAGERAAAKLLPFSLRQH